MSIQLNSTHVYTPSFSIGNERTLVIEVQSVINLPRYVQEYFEVEITNVSTSIVTITAIDPIYETLYAPTGTNEIIIDANRKIKVVYIIKSSNNLRGWYSVIS